MGSEQKLDDPRQVAVRREWHGPLQWLQRRIGSSG
jgi:hypothetical protein